MAGPGLYNYQPMPGMQLDGCINLMPMQFSATMGGAPPSMQQQMMPLPLLRGQSTPGAPPNITGLSSDATLHQLGGSGGMLQGMQGPMQGMQGMLFGMPLSVFSSNPSPPPDQIEGQGSGSALQNMQLGSHGTGALHSVGGGMQGEGQGQGSGSVQLASQIQMVPGLELRGMSGLAGGADGPHLVRAQSRLNSKL